MGGCTRVEDIHSQVGGQGGGETQSTNKDDVELQYYKWVDYLKLNPRQKCQLKQLRDEEEK